MKNYQDIEKYRKKRKKKKILKKGLMILILIILFLIVFSIYDVYKKGEFNTGIVKQQEAGEFPIVAKGEHLSEIYTVNNNIAAISKTNVLIYSKEAQELNTIVHGYLSPVVKENGNQLLIYDRGGSRFKTCVSSGEIKEKTITQQILKGAIATNGNIAIASTHESYTSIITVYNDKLLEIYKWSTNDRVINICFSLDDREMFVSTLTTNSGILSTNIYRLNLTSKTEQKHLIQDVLPLDIQQKDGDMLTIISNDSIMSYNQKNNEQRRINFNGELITFCKSPKESIVAIKSPFNGEGIVKIFDNTGSIKAQFEAKNDIIDISCNGTIVSVLCKDFVYILDQNLKTIKKQELTKSYDKIKTIDGNTYVMNTDIIDLIHKIE